MQGILQTEHYDCRQSFILFDEAWASESLNSHRFIDISFPCW